MSKTKANKKNNINGANPKKTFFIRYYYRWNSKLFIGIIAPITVLLVILASISAFLTAYFIDYKFKTDINKHIGNSSQFIEFVESVSRTGTRSSWALEADIDLTPDDVELIHNIKNRNGKAGAWFYGNLDGQGHSIRFINDAEINKPLFDFITNESRIENLCIESAVINTDKVIESAAVLAVTNEGTLSNVYIKKLTVKGEYIGENNISVAGIAVYNFGAITHCAVQANLIVPDRSPNDVTFVSDNGKKVQAVWSCRFGAISVSNSNGGKIIGAIVAVDFRDDFAVLSIAPYNDRQDRNLLIGYAVCSWNNSSDDAISGVYVLESKFISLVCDNTILDTFSGTTEIQSLINNEWTGWAYNKNINDGFPYFVS